MASTLPPSLLAIPPYTTTSLLRLQALYSDISRQKHSNPTSYNSNVEWWRKALQLIVSSGLQQDSGSRLVLKAGRGLMELVKVEGVGKPLSLGAVVAELRANKAFVSQHEFLTAKESIYNPGWLPTRIAAFVVGKPLWWALEQMGVVGEEGILGSSGGGGRTHADTAWWGEFVIISLVEKAADEVLERQQQKAGGPGDQLYSFEGFRKEFARVVGGDNALTDGDTRILLRFLERDRQAVVVENEVVKFIGDNMSGPREINAVDRGILELKTAVENLHAQVDNLQHKIEECTQKASDCLVQKRRPMALNHLRSKKRLEDLLSKRLGSLDTLESTLIRVEAAAGDIEILKSYESSTVTLRAILNDPSLQRESIDATMEALAEANADAREVDEAVKVGGDVAVGIEDEGDLEEELKGLIEEAEKEKTELESESEVRERLEAPGMEVPTSKMEAGQKAGVLAL